MCEGHAAPRQGMQRPTIEEVLRWPQGRLQNDAMRDGGRQGEARHAEHHDTRNSQRATHAAALPGFGFHYEFGLGTRPHGVLPLDEFSHIAKVYLLVSLRTCQHSHTLLRTKRHAVQASESSNGNRVSIYGIQCVIKPRRYKDAGTHQKPSVSGLTVRLGRANPKR